MSFNRVAFACLIIAKIIVGAIWVAYAIKSSEPRLKNMDCEVLTLDGWRNVHIEAGAAREGAFAVLEFIE